MRPNASFPSLAPLVAIVLSLLLMLMWAPTTTNGLRIVTTMSVPIQPFNSGGQGLCPLLNATGSAACISGFPLFNLLIRQSAKVSPDQIVMLTLDDFSRFIMFHPSGYSFNAQVWQRMGNVTGWFFYEVGVLTMATSPMVYDLFRAGQTKGCISHANIQVDNPLFDLLVRQIVVTAEGIRVAILVLSDWTRVVFPLYNPVTFLPPILKHIRTFYYIDMIVVMYGRPQDNWNELLGLDIDVIITGPSYNASLTTPPPVNYSNGTIIAQRSGLTSTVSFLDINITKWKQERYTSRNHASFWEVNMNVAFNFTTNPIDDAQYYADRDWLQVEVTRATNNDLVLGTSPLDVPDGTNSTQQKCRYSECELGNWWARMFYELMPTVDVVFINGGSFRKGWAAGPLKLGNVWSSNPFLANLCTFKVYGIDLYDIFNYSFSRGSATIAPGSGNGPFAQYYNARFIHNPLLNGSRIIKAEVRMANGSWGPIDRAKIYTVATTSYVCGGGDGYSMISVVPGTIKQDTGIEIHTAPVTVFQKKGSVGSPMIEGNINISDSTTPFIMKHVYQKDCVPNTKWVQALLNCVPCPEGEYNDDYGLTDCKYKPPTIITQQGSSGTPAGTIIGIIVGIAGGLLLLFLLVLLFLRWRRSERARKLVEAAPTGEVTMCFTDIQGSTSLWDQYPNEMAIALEIHNRVIREEILKFDGYEVKTIGDSFMIAFRNPVAAVECGISIQRRLLNEDWPEGLLEQESCKPTYSPDGNHLIWNGLRVRMGMQIGYPEPVVDYDTLKVDYFGPMVNQSARIESKAHGGEICVSKDLADMLEPYAGEKEWLLKYLGDFSFKGVSQKISVYSVHHVVHASRTYPPDKPNACDKCGEPLNCRRCDAELPTNIKKVKKRKDGQAILGGDRRGSVMSTLSHMLGREESSHHSETISPKSGRLNRHASAKFAQKSP